MTLLELDGLSIEYTTDEGVVRAVDGVDMTVEEGEILGLVGESGCGKTTIAKSIPRLLPQNGRISGGQIRYDGRDLTELDDEQMRKLRWSNISYILQNAMNALTPVLRIRKHFVDVFRTHTDRSKEEALAAAREILERVGLSSEYLDDYPHELSGGEQQRVVIGLALVLSPPLVIADEPTTGLDVVIQNKLLNLIQDLQSELGNAMIFITHDVSAVAQLADRVGVMYGGRLVELGPTREVFKRSAHPYTMGLKNSFPSLTDLDRSLVRIPGSPPALLDPPTGCVFESRCPFATDECADEPGLNSLGDGHLAKCRYTDRAPEFRERSTRGETWEERS